MTARSATARARVTPRSATARARVTPRDLVVEEVPWDAPAAVALRRAMFEEIAALHPGQAEAVEARGGFAWFDGLSAPGVVVVLLARVDGRAVGCAALRRRDLGPDGAEPATGVVGQVVKVFVEPAHRGSGAADALLGAVEDAAAALGLRVLVLDTGRLQHAAQRLYERHGYARVAPFGERADDAGCLFYAKVLPGP